VAAEVDEEPRVQRFYRVNNDPTDTVATILRRAVSGIEVDTLPGTHALVVVGTEAHHEAVEATLLEFDAPPDVVQLVQRTYFLSNARAATWPDAPEHRRWWATGENGASELDTVTVVAETRTNALIVTGTAAAQSRLASLIEELDRPQRQVNVQVRIQEITRSAALSLGIDWNAGFGNMTSQILGGRAQLHLRHHPGDLEPERAGRARRARDAGPHAPRGRQQHHRRRRRHGPHPVGRHDLHHAPRARSRTSSARSPTACRST
jgi:hypothetical protein